MEQKEEPLRDEQTIDKKKFDSTWTIARKKFMKRKLAMISLGFLLFIIVISFLAPYIATKDIASVFPSEINKEPSAEYWFGTDQNGRDVFQRLIHGGRVSLTIGLVSMLAVTIIGSLIGSVAGYFGGMIDNILMRFTDFILTLPFMVLVIVINSIMVSMDRMTGMWSLIIVFSLLGWGGVAR